MPVCLLPHCAMQCGKFHALEEFDGARRSCRGSLERHQQRRQRKRQHSAAQARLQPQQLQGTPLQDEERLEQDGEREQQQDGEREDGDGGQGQEEQQDGQHRRQPEQRRKQQRGSPAAGELPGRQQNAGASQERRQRQLRRQEQQQQQQQREHKQVQAQEQLQEQAEELLEEPREQGRQAQQVIARQEPSLQQKPAMAAPALQPALPPSLAVAAQPPQHPLQLPLPLNLPQQPASLWAAPALPTAAPLAGPDGRAWQQAHGPQVAPLQVVQGPWGLTDADVLSVSQPAPCSWHRQHSEPSASYAGSLKLATTGSHYWQPCMGADAACQWHCTACFSFTHLRFNPTNCALQLPSGGGAPALSAPARGSSDQELQQIYRVLQMDGSLPLPLPAAMGGAQLQALLGIAVDPQIVEELTTIHPPAPAAAGAHQLGGGFGRGAGAAAGLHQTPAVLRQAPAAAGGQLASWPGQFTGASGAVAGLLPTPSAPSAAGLAAATARALPAPAVGPAAQPEPAAAAAASSPGWPLSDDWQFPRLM